MSSESSAELKAREERKRDRCWDPAERWQAIQETIAWAEAQAAVPRNSPEKCLELQRKHLEREQGQG